MAVLRNRTICASRDPLVRFLFSRSKKKPTLAAVAEESKEPKDPDASPEVPAEEKETKETLLEDMDADDAKKDATLKAKKAEVTDAEMDESGEKRPPTHTMDGKVANAMELPITIEGDGKKAVVLSAAPKNALIKAPMPKVSLWRRVIPSWKKGAVTPVPEAEVDAVATWFNRTFVPASKTSNALETVSSLVVKNFNQGQDERDKETIKTRVTRNVGQKGSWTTVLPLWGKHKEKSVPQLWYTTMIPFRVVPHQTSNEVVSSNYFRLITQERSIEASSLTSGVPPQSSPALWPMGKMTGSNVTDLFGKQEPWYKRSPMSWLRKPPDPWWKKAISPWLKMPYSQPNPWHWVLIKRVMEDFINKRKLPKFPSLPIRKLTQSPKPAAQLAKPKK